MSAKTIRIGRSQVGEGQPAFIIAEVAWAHDGDPAKAQRIVEGAAAAGADAISIHVTSLPDYMIASYGNAGTVSAGKPASAIYDYLEGINLKPEVIRSLSDAAKKAGLALCLMPNDVPSLALAREIGPDALVLSPACFVEEDFVDALASAGLPVILRIGGATLGEIESTVTRLRAGGATDLLLLHGFQTYPTHLEETNLRAIRGLSLLFDCQVGLADHIDGGDPLALTIPALAIAAGATALEKHITWDRDEKGEDFESALDPKQFGEFVKYTRLAETALGQPGMPPFSAAILKYRQIVRKRVVAARDLQAGTKLAAADLVCRRSDAGAEPADRARLAGRTLRQSVKAGDPIRIEIVE